MDIRPSTRDDYAIPSVVVRVTTDFLAEVDARLPGRLVGLFLHGSLSWGEFFPGSDIDFAAVWDMVPAGEDLDLLRAAHEATRARHPSVAFDGFHCISQDLASDPRLVTGRPSFFESEFTAAGSVDINPVTWCELAQRPVVVRGTVPPVHHEMAGLVDFTRDNLDTYWRGQLDHLESGGDERFGQADWAVEWIGLGAPRLHYVLAHRELTSKSGAGRYLRDELGPRWSLLAREALRIRENPSAPSLYSDVATRGKDVREMLAWVIEDGTTTA